MAQNDFIEQLVGQSQNPAAPKGLRQTARGNAAEARAGGPDFIEQLIGGDPGGGYVDQAQAWYTGANTEETKSGWDSGFVEAFQSGWNTALEENTAADYFRNGGTGVVLWDHEGEGTETFRFGDVVRNGKRVGNVYDDFDTDTANLMLLPWLDDGTVQRRLFQGTGNIGDLDSAGDDVRDRVNRFVEGKHEENNANLEKALGAMAFQSEEIDPRLDELQEGASDELLAGGGGLAGGAVTGAATGALLTAWLGPGAAAGAVVGGVIGGAAGLVGGLMNKDEIAEAAARAEAISDLAHEKDGAAAGAAERLEQYAGLSMKFTSPLQNLSRGLTDWTEGDIGDGVSARYAVDDKGESELSGLKGLAYKTADWAALAGDSLMQFASPLSRAIYTAQMMGTIGGETGSLVLSGGEMFDPREGNFDNIFVDDDGNADPLSAAAGIAKIGIDLVQLGGLRGLAKASETNRAAVGAGLQAGQPVEMAGHRFILNEAGEVVGKKRTLALLAPSEQMAYWSAAREARVAAMKRGDAVTADDFYRAANNLANGSNKLKTAVVNAFGEGYEEAAQALLEPVAVDGELSGREVGAAFAYGAAAGAGMSLGATLRAPGSDMRMMAQAFVLETLRNDGIEPDWGAFQDEWKSLTQVEKNVRVARTPADIEVTRSATERIARDSTASMVASEVDVARAVDARRTAAEKVLASGTTRTDAYHVMGGLVDLDHLTPAEAVEASARTIFRLLDNRLTGMALQEEFLANRLLELDPADPKHAETTDLLGQVSLSRQFGEGLVADLADMVDVIYDENTTAVDAELMTRKMNELLAGLFERRHSPRAPEDYAGDEATLRDAAAHFVSLIQSREPKLDSGSYLALLPRASWDLTRDGSDNFLQVNTDILQAINGDFDGDKLRAENQLVLSRERFIQVRAGQNFAGGGREIDVAVRHFDAGMVEALAKGLRADLVTPTGVALRDEANAVMEKITNTISARYRSYMSPDALDRVFTAFEDAVTAGSEDARLVLMNGLAREAGEAITLRGRETLSNEWLWISKVYRANINDYQTEYRRLRNLDPKGVPANLPSATEPVEDFDTPEGVNRRKDRASTDAQTLALFGVGNTLFRKFQKIHYTWYNSSVLDAVQAAHADLYEMAQLYAELSRGVTRSELSRVGVEDTIAGRVQVMLWRLVNSALETDDVGEFNPQAAMAIFANVKVKDVWFDANENPATDGQDLTLVQVLMKRALEAEREEHKRTFDFDQKLQAKHNRLRALTIPNSAADEVNAERAFLEVFKAVPFGESLGGNTGNLAMHTTPEQWLRNYVAHDPDGRRDLEEFYTNAPEYLSRKERSNIPYSFDEAKRKEVTPYRSMMDAMLAVGRAELTFDPSKKDAAKAFGGRIGKADRTARDNYKTIHAEVRAAMRDFRKMRNRTAKTREEGAVLVQQMFEASPQQAHQILDMIPGAAAEALYEFRDGQPHVVPWIYEMFAIENADEALFFYWKNLVMAQWNTTQIEGRTYAKLNSRFQRLLYQLNKAPGQAHLEILLRKMHTAKNLDEFFVWLNTTPGFRGEQAPLLPFFDDVADFEADAAGGWVTVSQGADLREALTTAKRAAKELRKTIAFRKTKDATDRLILEGIKRALAKDPAADPVDYANLEKLQKAVSIAQVLPRGFAPSAMLALTRGVVRGVDAHSHDKGQTATSYAELGEFQALMDAFAFVPGLERAMEVLTAHSIGSLRTNLGDLARTTGLAMDEHGRQVEWEPLTVEQAVEMLDDPRTAPLAHALLTPTAMDVTPAGLTERLLMEASLKDLLDNDHYRELFRSSAKNQLDIDTRYLSMLDMRARAEGGHFDAIRIANDLAIVMTSGLGRPARPEDEERFTAQAYHYVAEVMRMVGSVQASKDMRDAGMLATLRTTAQQALRQQRLARLLPGFTDRTTGEVVETWVKRLLDDMETEYEAQKKALVGEYKGKDLTRRTNALKAQHARDKQRLTAMLDDNQLATTVARFELSGDPAADTAQHARIAEYVLSMSNFPMRAPEAADAWNKLAGQAKAGVFDLEAGEWDTLARAAMGVTLVDDTLRVASHVSIPPLPKAPSEKDGGGDPSISDARFYKYFDPTYSFLVTDLLQENSPLARAAVWLHGIAEQPSVVVPIKKLERTLFRTLLSRDNFGAWTPGLMSQIVEAQQRMDSAGAPPGIAAAGNGPKRWAAVAASTRRSGWVPGADLLTTAKLNGDYLADNASPFNEIPVQPAGSTEASMMPVGLLDNRFYAGIRFNGVAIPLDADNLGFGWDGADGPHPYRYIALERLTPVLQRFAAANDLALADVEIELDFFHPDSQPADAMHNAFFEGMSHSLLPDGSESLVATLWSDNSGMISKATQWTIDAGKKGLRAIMPMRRSELEPALAEAEARWHDERDFAGMLRRKTEALMSYDDGSGALDLSYYNAVYKHMKLSHILVGFDADGNPAALTAEQVIAHQAANGRAADLPLTDAKLVQLSPDVLRSMLGETGDQGVTRFFDDEYLFNPDLVQPYEGITPRMLSRFGAGWLAETGAIGDTRLAHVGPQRVMKVRTMMTKAERNARAERRIYLDKIGQRVRAQRFARLKKKAVREDYRQILEEAAQSVATERTSIFFNNMGASFIGPKNSHEAVHSGTLLETFASLQESNGWERGWRVADDGVADYPGGVLTVESLHEKRDEEHWVVKDDVALVDLQTFVKPERTHEVSLQRVEKALQFLVESGAYVVLGPGDATGDLRFEGAQFLIERGYVPIQGSKHVYGPPEFVFQSQNERAYESSLTETKKIRPARNAVTFLSIDPLELDENDAVGNPESKKLRSRKLVGNLVPSNFGNYNVPLEDNRDYGLYARTLNHLRSQLDPANTEARAVLLKQAGEDAPLGKGIEEALNDFHAKITDRSSLMPEVGDKLEVGDIIPFVHPDGKVLLYRHGFKLPAAKDLPGLHAMGGLNIALAKSETEPLATANSGTIREVEDKVGFGKRLQLEIPLQPHGDKVQLEWNGMKYVLVPKPSKWGKIPRLFRNGTVVDLISDVQSADSKEAFEGRVYGYRNALAFFQFDFTDDMVKFFFPGSNPSDPDFAAKRVLTVDLLDRLGRQDSFRIPFTDANAIAKSNVRIGELLGEFAEAEATRTGEIDASWADRLQDGSQDPSSLIARAMITYLLTPGANYENVLKSAGFSHPRATNDSVETRLVPGLFADLLDNGLDSPLHDELIRRFDRQLLSEADGSGFKLHSNWTVEMFDGQGGSRRGYLQFGEVHSSGDNPVLDGQAFDPTERAGLSPHNAMAAFLSFGATTAHEDLEKIKAFASAYTAEGDVSKFGESGDSVWQMLTALPNEKDTAMTGWRRELPAETARRQAARREQVGLYHPLVTEGWNEGEEERFHQAAIGFLNSINLVGEQRAMVDSMVRDYLGRPYELDENGNERGVIPFKDAMQALRKMQQNVNAGLLPHAGANIPLIDVNYLTAIYLANVKLPDGSGWAPKVSMERNAPRAGSWDAWVEVAFGTAWIVPEGQKGLGPQRRFHLMYLLAVDGRMHGYQNATTNTRYLPVSSDILRQRMLMDPQTNKMLVSISADENLLATDPTLFHSSRAELEEIVVGQRIYGPGRNGPDPNSAEGHQDARINQWHREANAPRQARSRMRDIRRDGNTFIGYSTTTAAWARMLMNLRVGNTLFNLSLIVAAPFEAFYRRQINSMANSLTGDSIGAAGRAQARFHEMLGEGKFRELLEGIGFERTYTPDQHRQFRELTGALASLPEFQAMIYKELVYQYPSAPGIGRIEKALERYAKFGGRIQDPAWGMRPKDLARVYLETVLRRLSQNPTGENIYSVARLIKELPRNPEWVKRQDAETHAMAVAAIANIRSTKPTPLSMFMRGWIEPLSENPKVIVNTTGNFLKVMTAFQNFWANFGTNVTGLQGASDFMAYWLDGREKKLTARAQAALRGEEYVPEEAEYFNMTETLESLDLADAFIRGGVTHSALFALGMAAGGLGLSGEDDETKWRRRQAELQGVPVLFDPRDIENDFRNRDAIYLDWLPFGMDSLFKADENDPDSRSLAQMNWIARTFLSPVIGFERFYNTGDFTEVLLGFKDAIGSHPIVNQQIYTSAMETAGYLQAQANDAAEKGDEVESGHLLMSAVGVLEGMLFENSMVNMVYVGRDEWDRDPYLLPLTDSDGDAQRDIEGNVRENDLATRMFVNDEGDVQVGYLGRSQAGADARVLTENRATMAFVASLFDGGIGKSDFWRYNMPVKTRTMERPEADQEEVEALVKAAVAYQLAQVDAPNITDEEAMKGKIRNDMYQLGERTGQFFQDDQIWKVSREWAATQGTAAASILDSVGREHLTDEGARRLFRGLLKGTITLDDPAMSGVYIPYEMREKISAEWAEELVQEGIDLGLDETNARNRMKRLMQGPLDNPEAPGLGDILWDKRISYSNKLVYGQLNTTYVMGPDERPWATGFKRDGLLGAMGLKPFKGMIQPEGGGTGLDSRGNTVDLVNGVNTGLRALVPFDDSRNVPTDNEIADKIIEAIENAAAKQYTPFTPFEKKGGGGYGWGGYGKRSYGGYGGGGYSGGGGYFSKMYSLPDQQAPYGNSISAINSSNPILRRAFIRRERVWSERGRLNQWQ